MNRKFAWTIVLLAFGLASCGGEGPGLAGGRNNSDDPADDPIELGSLELLTSSSQLQSDGSTVVTITAVAKDASNIVVADVPVGFAASSGSLTVIEGTTNEQGIATAELTTGGDPTNRTINITANGGTLASSVNVDVIGSSIQIQGPSSLVNDATGNYTATLFNSAGTGVANETVTINSSNGNTLSASTLDTDANGRVSFTLDGDNAGNDTISVSALPDADGTPTVSASFTVNVSGDDFRFTSPNAGTEVNIGANRTVTVIWESNGTPQDNQTIRFATTRGDLTFDEVDTDASGEASTQVSSTTAGPAVITATNPDGTTAQLSIEFVATTPNQVSLQSDPGVISRNETSTITATVQDADNNRVKNATVEFTLTDTTGGTLSTASAVTDSQGRAQTVYTASSQTSADDGVVITGRVVDAAADCTAVPKVLCADTSLTVSGQALFIVFGTGNSIVEDDLDTIYTKHYSLFVSDSSGKGVANTNVSLRMLPTGYLKGDLDPDAIANAWVQTITATCPSEDINGNGVLDETPVLEDLNGDDELSPGNIAVVAPGTVTTDTDGRATFSISYPQNYALWVTGRITASATVAGTESRKSENFFFPASADDLELDDSPPNTVSPWGTSGSCNDTL